ncbi:MAG: MbnH family di-heme enzyme [Bryobacteraceae bacterium]
MGTRLILAVLGAVWLSAAQPYHWDLPKGFSQPAVPAGNPMSEVKVRLGRYLFYDARLSVNGKQSCSTCHRQELAFTDGRAAAVGATGQSHPRSAMSLVNVAYSAMLTWSDPAVRSLEQQALIPLLSEDPVEMGMGGHEQAVFQELRGQPVYRDLFPLAFPEERGARATPFTLANVAKALAAFERTIISTRSPYDRYHLGGERDAISEAAKRGEVLFYSDPVAGCYRCHSGPNFTDGEFHNTGLYNVKGAFSYPWPNLGIYRHTKNPADVGKFRTPGLRNIALTAPYMHDGSVATLEEVLDHYAAGGRTLVSGPYAGCGRDNPHKDPRIGGIELTAQNRLDLLAFLRSLTDTELTRDPRFADPW